MRLPGTGTPPRNLAALSPMQRNRRIEDFHNSNIVKSQINAMADEETPLIREQGQPGSSLEQASYQGIDGAQEIQPSVTIVQKTSTFILWCTALSWICLLTVFTLTLWARIDSNKQISELSLQLRELRGRLDVVESQSDGKFFLVQDQLRQLQQQEDDKIKGLSDSVSYETFTRSAQYAQLSVLVGEHDKALIRLSNGTSNADVLDTLQRTKNQVYSALNSTVSEISNSLHQTQQEVSVQLQQSAEQLQSTQKAVGLHLNDTVLTVRAVVQNATAHIHEVQRNVTGQLDGMSVRLSTTVQELSQSVQRAQDTIHEEVNVVQANIEQYVAITNKQFAAENDFVRYQIAGMEHLAIQQAMSLLSGNKCTDHFIVSCFCFCSSSS